MYYSTIDDNITLSDIHSQGPCQWWRPSASSFYRSLLTFALATSRKFREPPLAPQCPLTDLTMALALTQLRLNDLPSPSDTDTHTHAHTGTGTHGHCTPCGTHPSPEVTILRYNCMCAEAGEYRDSTTVPHPNLAGPRLVECTVQQLTEVRCRLHSENPDAIKCQRAQGDIERRFFKLFYDNVLSVFLPSSHGTGTGLSSFPKSCTSTTQNTPIHSVIYHSPRGTGRPLLHGVIDVSGLKFKRHFRTDRPTLLQGPGLCTQITKTTVFLLGDLHAGCDPSTKEATEHDVA